MLTTRSSFLSLALGTLGALGVMCSLAGCGGKTLTTSAALANPNGQSVGSVMFSQTGSDAVQVTINVNGLPPGPHGIHVHDVGKCEAPDFMTAGGHFNPTMQSHGDPNSPNHHVGDLGNLTVGANGSGTLTASSTTMSLDSANPGYISGRAFIVHQSQDDLTTQPTGNSGARIACGVIAAPQ